MSALPRGPGLWLAGLAGVALLGVAQAQLLYETSPMVGVGVPIVLAVGLAILHDPRIGLLLGLAAIPAEVARTSAGSFSLSPMEAVLVLTAGAIVVRWATGAERLRVDPVLLAYGAGLLWILVGYGQARDGFIVMRILVMWTAFGVVGLYVANLAADRVRQVLGAVVLAAAANSAIALLSGTAQEARQGATAVEGRAQGAFTHPSQLAFFLVMALPAALVLALRSRGAWRPLWAACSAMTFVALMLTLTRGAIIGAAFSLAIMLVWAPFRRLAAVILMCLLLFAAVNWEALSRSDQLSLVSARLATVLDRESANVNNGRLRIWATVPQIAADHPVFGLGAGNFKDYSLEYGLSEGGVAFEHAHNVALTALVELGIPGFLMLVLTLVLLGRHAAVALRARGDPRFPLALAAIAGLGGLFVNSLTDYPPSSNPDMALLLIEFGVLVSVARALRSRHT